MSTPFFSVLVPTKRTENRVPAPGNAVRSVLGQTFGDLEVVVADDSDDEFADVVRAEVQGCGDARVKYVRTAGNLRMADTWEQAAKHASGTYLTVLTDRSVYRRESLALLAGVLRESGAPLVSWYLDSFGRDPDGSVYVRIPSSATVRRFSRWAIFDLLMRANVREWSRYLPRMMNSCVHRAVLRSVRETTGGRAFFPVNPDYTGGLLQLAHVDTLVHVDLPLYVPCGTGNGRSLRRGKEGGRRFMADQGIDRDTLYRFVPLKEDLVHNLIIRDFMEVRALCQGRLDALRYDRATYLVECLRDVAVRKHAGSPWQESRAAVLRLLDSEPLPTRVRVALSNEYQAVGRPDALPARLGVGKMVRAPRTLASLARNRLSGGLLEADKLDVPSRDVWEALAADEDRPRLFGRPRPSPRGETLQVAALEQHWPWKNARHSRRVAAP